MNLELSVLQSMERRCIYFETGFSFCFSSRDCQWFDLNCSSPFHPYRSVWNVQNKARTIPFNIHVLRVNHSACL